MCDEQYICTTNQSLFQEHHGSMCVILSYQVLIHQKMSEDTCETEAFISDQALQFEYKSYEC